MVTFQEEPFAACWAEAKPLTEAHHAGTASYRRHEPLKIDAERFTRYNEAGIFHWLTARDQGVLVGYFGVYVMDSMHSQRPIATEDTFFLHPQYRGGRTALRFLRYVEQFLQAWARPGEPLSVLFSCEIDNDTGIQRLLHFLDYEPVITVYTKCLHHRADSAVFSEKELQHVGALDAL